ncbi:MAG: hypothetical protein O2971_11370 [Proteobacteria bacterium]|nr:hypothetical protein [Pseudomonadota bacterium]
MPPPFLLPNPNVWECQQVDPAKQHAGVNPTQMFPVNNLDDYANLRSGIYQAIID